MIDLKDLREDPQRYRRGAELKGVKVDIDAVLRADETRIASQQESRFICSMFARARNTKQ